MTEQQILALISEARAQYGNDCEAIWLAVRDHLPPDERRRQMIRYVLESWCNPRDASEADATGTP